MVVSLLNENQQRRLASHLRLLSQDLDTLAQSPELARGGGAYERIRTLVAAARRAADEMRAALDLPPDLVAAARRAADEMRAALDLPPDRSPSLKRRIGALGEVWAVRMEDLVARRLRPYGAVHPGLAARLDPHVERLRDLCAELADAAQGLPEA